MLQLGLGDVRGDGFESEGDMHAEQSVMINLCMEIHLWTLSCTVPPVSCQ